MEAIAPEGRMAKKRRSTRARLLQAAHVEISAVGVDASKIKAITDRADVGFGTFYNYFESKDVLASQVLDCVIDDLGRRNVAATRGLARRDPALVMPTSIRLVLRSVSSDPVWQWWTLRPDLLFDRMEQGFGRFGQRDMREAIKRDIFRLDADRVAPAWRYSVWLMVAGIHDSKTRSGRQDSLVAEAIMRVMGVSPDEALRLATVPLPRYPPPDIDWTFAIDPDDAKSD